jgi:hypothetical protein
MQLMIQTLQMVTTTTFVTKNHEFWMVTPATYLEEEE